MQNKTYSELPIVVTIIPKTEPQHVGEYPSLTISVRLGLSSETPDFLGPHDIPVAVYHRKNIITWPSSSVDPVGFFGYLMITTWRKEFTNRSFDLLITHWIAFWRSHPQFINKPWPQGTPGPQSLQELPAEGAPRGIQQFFEALHGRDAPRAPPGLQGAAGAETRGRGNAWQRVKTRGVVLIHFRDHGDDKYCITMYYYDPSFKFYEISQQ